MNGDEAMVGRDEGSQTRAVESGMMKLFSMVRAGFHESRGRRHKGGVETSYVKGNEGKYDI